MIYLIIHCGSFIHSLQNIHSFNQCSTFVNLLCGAFIHSLKLSMVEPGQYLDGRPPVKTRLLLEEVLVRSAGGAHPVVCVSPNAPV